MEKDQARREHISGLRKAERVVQLKNEKELSAKMARKSTLKVELLTVANKHILLKKEAAKLR